MRIVCPACQAAYEVPDKLLSAGQRRVRCARCGGDWVPEPVAATPVAQLAPPAEPEPPEVEDMPPSQPVQAAEPEPDLPATALARMPVAPAGPRAEEKLASEPSPRAARRMAVLAGLAWAASLALLGAGAWAGIAFRHDVMAAWAPSRRLFALLGLG